MKHSLIFLAAGALVAAIPSGSFAAAEYWTVRVTPRDGAPSVVAERTAPGGNAAFTLDSSTQRRLATPAIALDGRGGAAAAWVSAGPDGAALMASRFDGRTWEPGAALIRSPGYLGQPTLAADGRGGYWLAVARSAGRGEDIALFRWDGGELREAGVFGERGVPDIDPWLERSAAGAVRLAWRSFDGGAYRRREVVVEAGAGGPASLTTASPAVPDGLSGATPPGSSRAVAAWSDGGRVASAPLAGEPGTERRDAGAAADAGAAVEAAAGVAQGPPDLSRVLGLGDSTTWGRGSVYQGPPTDYLTRLEIQLHGPWTTLNDGHPGSTSADLLDILENSLKWRPGLTLLMVGINDAFNAYSADTVYLNLRTLIDRIRAVGSSVVVATTTPVIDDAAHFAQHEYLDDVVNPAIRAAARDAGAPLVDLWKYFDALPNWRSFIYLPHGNHLNDAGYEIVAARFRQLLQRNDLALPARGTARGPLLADVSLAAWDLPVPGAKDAAGNAGAALLFRDGVSPLADDGVVAAAPLDLDGDGVDGIAVVRARLGELSLVVYNAPPAGTLTDGAVLAAVTEQATADWLPDVCACPAGETRKRRAITHLFGVDQDGDGRDEFGFVCSRTCQAAGGVPTELQVVEVWRAHQPELTAPERVVMDEWLLPGGGWIHDAEAIQGDADPAEEIVLLTQYPRVASLHTLGAANPDAIRYLGGGRYGRLFDCATQHPPKSWGICNRWLNRGKTECGVVELRTLTPRVVVYDTPPAGADTKDEQTERLLYTWWQTESPLLAARCADTGEEWAERFSDVLGLAAADISQPADGLDELLLLRQRTVDTVEAWDLPALPAGPAKQPSLVGLDKWVRTGQSHEYFPKAGTIPDGSGGGKPALLLWLDKR